MVFIVLLGFLVARGFTVFCSSLLFLTSVAEPDADDTFVEVESVGYVGNEKGFEEINRGDYKKKDSKFLKFSQITQKIPCAVGFGFFKNSNSKHLLI